MLAEDTARTREKYLSTSRGEDSTEHRDNIYHSLVLRGKLKSSVQWITKRDNGGVIQPENTCPKTGQTVLDVLRSNHPKVCQPPAQSLEAYRGKPLAMVPLDITYMTVATVARRLLGSAGLGGV